MSDIEDRSAENPYAAPMSGPTASQSIPTEDSGQRALRAFVNSKADYYLQKWNPLIEGTGSGAGFNGAAFLLSGFWLGYRKMYKIAAIFYSVIIVESIAEEVFFVGILGEEVPPMLGSIVGLVAAIICGSYGNRWYLSHARRVISDVHAQGLEGQAAARALSKRGGTSLGSALGLFVLFLAVTVVVFIAVGFVLYPLEGP